MNVEIGTEHPLFLFWEYLFRNFGILSLQCSCQNVSQFSLFWRVGEMDGLLNYETNFLVNRIDVLDLLPRLPGLEPLASASRPLLLGITINTASYSLGILALASCPRTSGFRILASNSWPRRRCLGEISELLAFYPSETY